jgi:hypothetical protein
VVLLLKALTYLGYVPDSLNCVPREVRSFIAGQLGLLWGFSEQYQWDSRTRELHLSEIRWYTGWRFPTAQDKDDLEHWLREEAAAAVYGTFTEGFTTPDLVDTAAQLDCLA